MAAGQPFTQVDAFADQPFAGNPAAVCVLPAAREAALDAARRARDEPGGDRLPRAAAGRLRPPLVHARRARWISAVTRRSRARTCCGTRDGFPTTRRPGSTPGAGVLTAERSDGLIWLDLPATPAAAAPAPVELERGLGVPLRFVGQTRFDYLVELESDATVRRLEPDLSVLGRLAVRGVIVTAASATADQDFVSRFFAPAAGIPEDPVTGSAHCALAPFWAERLGQHQLSGYQASARGGLVRLRLAGDRVHLGGPAVTMLRGALVH